MSSPLVIDYYSDVLCVWAWIAQHRIDKLNKCFGNKIAIKYHYVDIFGDAVTKISTQWKAKGEFEGFSSHVIESASKYEEAHINSTIWSKTKPTSSANPHLVLKAIEQSYSCQYSLELALKFRQAFFIDAVDISNMDLLFNIMEQSGLDCGKVNTAIASGSAMAALMSNYQQSRTLNLQGSPTYILDSGRQTLYGNVGYRVLQANIEALLCKAV